MLTQRRRSTRDDGTLVSATGRPVVLATLDVPFADDASVFAVDSAVESGQPLVLVNAAEVLPTLYTVLGYGYVERDDLQEALSKPAALARSLAVEVERLRICSPHPVEALLELTVERDPSVLVFGPDRSALSRRRYRKAVRAIRERAPCLVWTDER